MKRAVDEHTPTPWIADDGDGQYFVIAQEETGELIAVLVEPTSKGGHDILLPRDENYVKAALGEGQHELVYGREVEHKANAAFIVKAVNNHDALVTALKKIAAGGYPGASHIAREALAKVQLRERDYSLTRVEDFGIPDEGGVT